MWYNALQHGGRYSKPTRRRKMEYPFKNHKVLSTELRTKDYMLNAAFNKTNPKQNARRRPAAPIFNPRTEVRRVPPPPRKLRETNPIYPTATLPAPQLRETNPIPPTSSGFWILASGFSQEYAKQTQSRTNSLRCASPEKNWCGKRTQFHVPGRNTKD